MTPSALAGRRGGSWPEILAEPAISGKLGLFLWQAHVPPRVEPVPFRLSPVLPKISGDEPPPETLRTPRACEGSEPWKRTGPAQFSPEPPLLFVPGWTRPGNKKRPSREDGDGAQGNGRPFAKESREDAQLAPQVR